MVKLQKIFLTQQLVTAITSILLETVLKKLAIVNVGLNFKHQIVIAVLKATSDIQTVDPASVI